MAALAVRHVRETRPPHVPSPLVVLRASLTDARHGGVDFDAAWGSALPAALAAAVTRRERENWEISLGATRAAWRAAYTGEPPPAVHRAAGAIIRYREFDPAWSPSRPSTRRPIVVA